MSTRPALWLVVGLLCHGSCAPVAQECGPVYTWSSDLSKPDNWCETHFVCCTDGARPDCFLLDSSLDYTSVRVTADVCLNCGFSANNTEEDALIRQYVCPQEQ